MPPSRWQRGGMSGGLRIEPSTITRGASEVNTMTIPEITNRLIIAILRRLSTRLTRNLPLALVFFGLPLETPAMSAKCLRDLHTLDQDFHHTIPSDPHATQAALNLRREAEQLCRNSSEEPARTRLPASAARLKPESPAKPQAQK